MSADLKHIAIVSKGDPRSTRTWSGTAANLCRTFEAAGVQVTAVDSYGSAPRSIELAMKAASKAFYLNSRFARLGRIEQPWRARRAAARLHATRQADHVLHLHALDALSLPTPKTDARHSIVMDTTWDVWRKFSSDAFNVSPRLSADAFAIEKAMFHAATHLFPLSEYVRENLITRYGVPAERITVIGTGRGAIQPYHGAKDYRQGPILFAAKERFVDKGGDRLVAGFQIAHHQMPELQLVIVGRPEYEAMFRGLEGITAYGHVSLEELQRLFERASLFAMPAVFEPWGLVYLEALACRTPVLGLRDHALPEITREGRYGFCLQSGSAEEIAEALLAAFRDPERLARMGFEGQRHCLETFTWEQTVRRILDRLRT